MDKLLCSVIMSNIVTLSGLINLRGELRIDDESTLCSSALDICFNNYPNFLYLIRFGATSPKRFLRFSS